MACGIQFDETYSLVGDPVDAVSGANQDMKLDFQMPGPIPFQWVRHYDSLKCQQHFALGWGRTHGYDRKLQFDVDGLRYTAPVGRIVGFPPLKKDGERFSYGGYNLERVSSRIYRLHRSGEPSMEFRFRDIPTSTLARLIRGQDSIQFHYGAQDRLQGIVDSRGRSIAVTSDEVGRIIALVLARSEGDRPLINYRYDLAGNLIEGVDPYRNSFSFRYDHNNREVTRTDRLGYSFYFDYDDQGKCIRTSGQDGLHDTRLEYHPQEGVTLVTRADGGLWTYLCPGGQLTRIIDPYGGSRDFKRNEAGRIAEEIDSNGNVTRLRYDSNGAPAGKVSPLGRFMSRGDDPRKPPVNPFAVWRFMPASEDPERMRADSSVPSRPDEWELGNFRRKMRAMLTEASPESNSARLRTPERFRHYMRARTPAAEQRRIYDEFGKLVREENPDGSSSRRLYDANGNLNRLIDRDGSPYVYQNASWNLRVQTVNPLGQTEQFTYNKAEKLAVFTDAGGTASHYEYDLKDQLIRVRRHGVIREEYRYDNSGNLIEKLDGEGKRLFSFEIGPGNVRTARHLEGGKTHSFGYDKQGRLVRAATEESEIELGYDSCGNRTKDQRGGLGLTHIYTGPGRLAKSVYFDRFLIQYSRSENALTIVDSRGSKYRIEVLEDEAVLRSFANGSSELMQFDEQGRCLLKAAHRRGRASIWSRQYSYSGEGDLLIIQDSMRGTTRYEYDAAHRLNRMEQSGEIHPFAYDAAGNLLQQPGLRATIRDGNRLQTANGEQIEYNSRNHIAARKSWAGETRYSYDELDMLTACDSPKGHWQAKYDALSRRIAASGKHWTEFYWDGDRLAAEISEGGAVRLYIYADEFALTPLLFVEYENIDSDPASGTGYYIFGNHLGAPLLVEDEAGRTVWEARLDPYGFAHVDPQSSLELGLRFPGHYYDPEIGLHYNRYRYYSPELGRYLQSDPAGIRGGANLYRYTTNPLKSVDVLGLNECGPDDETEEPPPPDPATVARTGKPSAATTWRGGEVPYHNPDEMYVVRPGLPLDLDALDPNMKYLWVVDPNGNILIAPEQQPGFGANDAYPQGRPVKHGDLTPGEDGLTRGPARAGGELKVVPDTDGRVWEMNNDSSYTFNREDGRTGTQDNLDASHDLMTQSGTDTTRVVQNNSSGVQ